MQDLIYICKQITFSLFSLRNSCETDKATGKNCQTNFCCLNHVFQPQLHLVVKFLCLLWQQTGFHFSGNLHEFGLAWRWIAPHIPSLNSQSEHAKNTIHCFSLVFTKSVSSTFRTFWLAPITRNILGYSLFCIQSQDGFSLRDMFGNLSNNWSSHTNKIIPTKRLTLACRCLLVGFIIFILNLQQNRKNALDKISEMFENC